MAYMTKFCATIVLLVFMLSGCASLPKKPENLARGDYSFTKEYITGLIKKEMKKNDVTGLSIALVDDQRVVWAEGFGYADEENKVSATPETIYRAGSISKLFTATAAMQLAEQGKLDIDKPLKTYLPEFFIKSRFPDAGPITPRTIMTHHSGLPSDLSKGMMSKQPEPFENAVKMLRDEYVANPPNFVYSYSNLGVTLLGHALEKVTGRDFASLVETSVMRPMGMHHSTFAQAPDRSLLGAKAYRKGKPVDESPLRDLPAGGLNTSVLDLSHLMEMVFAGGWSGKRQIIKPETMAEMLRPQNTNVPLDFDFRIGLSWMLGGLDIRNAGPVAHHGGDTPNFHNQMILLPEQKLGVVVMSNSATAVGVVRKVANEALKLALEARNGIKQPEQAKTTGGEGSLSHDELQAYVGHYATVAGLVNITKKSDYLLAEAMGSSLRLVPRPDGQLGPRYKLLGIIPISLGEFDNFMISRATVVGREIVKGSMNGLVELVAERIKTVPISEAIKKRVGEYEIVNAGDDTYMPERVRLRVVNDLLLVEYVMPLFTDKMFTFAVAPVSDNELIICGLGRGKGETIRVVTVDGEELIKYSGYLFKKK